MCLILVVVQYVQNLKKQIGNKVSVHVSKLLRISTVVKHEIYCVYVIYSPVQIQKTCPTQTKGLQAPAKRCQFLKDCTAS